MFHSFTVKCSDVAATENLAKKLSSVAVPRDVFLLSGTLGIGKSVFARAFIQSLIKVKEVPSPTFTLVQTYETPSFDIYHFDLYRLKSAEEIWELNIEEAFSNAVSLVEWPEKMDIYAPRTAIKINITADEGGNRIFEINFPTDELVHRFKKALFSDVRNIHATTVDIDGCGVLLIGASGVGKSDLALRLIQNKNAILISDDQTNLTVANGKLIARAPQTIQGLLEVRGLGIIQMPFKSETEVKLAVISASKEEIERYPSGSFFKEQDVSVRCLLLDFFESSTPDKIILKLRTLFEKENLDKQNFDKKR